SDAAMEDDRAEGQPVLLNRHAREVEQEARNLCRALGVPQPLQEAVALAARLHDLGKKAERWQRAFHAPTDGIYAKTEGPIDHGLLDGYRHEVGSLICAEQDPQVQQLDRRWRELVLHLIAAHHGSARPVLSIEACDFAPPSVLQEKGVEAALRFARLQRAWGPWGLAWCEALLRAADQTASVFSLGEPVRSGCSDA
ncbi:MAG: CRISPR-associated endonuclease Cas3'', partial [Phycisphaerales bacterium]|nr:CRISPR-associated endonuclease Cas3'' [Phycisphaerales bacterium]